MSSSINLFPSELDVVNPEWNDSSSPDSNIVDIQENETSPLSFTALDFTELAKKIRSATVKISGAIEERTIYDETPFTGVSGSAGSGFFISDDGYLVTNYHVIQGMKKIEVIYAETSKKFQATCVGSDPELDVAVLKIDSEESLPYLLFAQKCLIGQKAMLVGNPRGYENIITAGCVALENHSICSSAPFSFSSVGGLNEYILYDGTSYHGNSGGALVDECGNALGILSRGEPAFPLGYAGSGPHLKRVVNEIIENGFVARASLGFRVANAGKALCQVHGLSSGVYVQNINPESNAYQAGLRFGDVIRTCNEKPIVDVGTWLQDLALRYAPHHVVHLQVERGEVILDIFLELEERKVNLPTRIDSLGAGFVDINSEMEMYMGFDPTKKGALIWTLDPKGFLGSFGFVPGDVVTGVVLEDGVEIACDSVEDLINILNRIKDEKHYWIKHSNRCYNRTLSSFVSK